MLNPDIEITAIAIVFLLKSEEVDYYKPHFEESDLIISQLIGPYYPCDFVRTNKLKELYGNKLIIISNLYYRGYNPELIYIPFSSIKVPPASGYLKGPLGDYHNKTFFDSWKEGVMVKEVLNRHVDFDYNEGKYSNVINSTMEELETREKDVDIKMTDIIKKDLDKYRLFFTINHPTMRLLTQMAERILKKAELRINYPKTNYQLNELLNNIAIPVNVYSKSKLNISFDDLSYFKGNKYYIESDGNIRIGEQHIYNNEDLIKEFYQIYDRYII